MTLIAALLVIIVLIFVVELVRRQKIREKYAILWIFVGVGTLIMAAFPGVLAWASEFVGVQVPSNLLFAVALTLLAGVCLQISREISLHEEKIRTLTEEVAILRVELTAQQKYRPRELPPGSEPKDS